MIEAHLDSTRMFGAVLSSSPEVKAEFRLDSEVMGRLQDFDAGDSKVMFRIKVNLVDVSNRTLVNSKSFDYVQPANGANPEAGISATKHAVERMDCSRPQ